MKVKSDYPSSLSLEEIIILESSFERSPNPLDNLELRLKVNHEIKNNTEDDEEYIVILETYVSDDNNNLSVHVKSRAKFRTNQENIDLVEKNAIAIMFPYIRSYVSTLTTQPGISPIVLPVMNIVSLLNNKQQ